MEQRKATQTPRTTLQIPLKEDDHNKLDNADVLKFRSLVGRLL